jgi:hypothetical protein
MLCLRIRKFSPSERKSKKPLDPTGRVSISEARRHLEEGQTLVTNREVRANACLPALALGRT